MLLAVWGGGDSKREVEVEDQHSGRVSVEEEGVGREAGRKGRGDLRRAETAMKD